MILRILFIALTVFTMQTITVKEATALSCRPPTCGCCAPRLNDCQNRCGCISTSETGEATDPLTTIGHISDEFRKHRNWMADFFYNDPERGDPAGIVDAVQLMTDQLVTNGMQHVMIVGKFFDAKHQLETQRLFQVLTARAVKDYQPSQNLCSFGTMTGSLAESNRKLDITSSAIAKRLVERQALTADTIGATGNGSDQLSRLRNFIENYCDPTDNANNNDYLCLNSNNIRALYNRDISYAKTVQNDLTLNIDLAEETATNTPDEDALFALNNNLLSHTLYPFVSGEKFVDENGNPEYEGGARIVLDSRALIAKRSVAANSLASIAALKAKGDDKSQPFIYALIREMGGDAKTLAEIQDLIGDNPSYYAQMKILTKLYYQRPEFFVDLYDKPANVARMNAALQATTLMRKRDLYRSYLRSEMTLAVMLETALQKEIDFIENEISAGGTP